MTHSTRKELKVDICDQCHPFYTGKLKLIATAGRIDKFKKKFSEAGYASLKSGKKATPVEMYARRMYSKCEDEELKQALPDMTLVRFAAEVDCSTKGL